MNNKEIKELKELIIKKFGSVRAFAFHEQQFLNSWNIIRFFRNETKRNVQTTFQLLKESAEALKPERKTISPGQREIIRRTLLIHFKTVSAFCEQNKRFSKTFISNVINGNKLIFDERTKDLFRIVLKLHSLDNEKEFKK